ncbi:hypothetical protein [Microtetraspora fusca]|uniref:hypothetical protein n=1 Tax=Microtetraspora fusca TaxID=1997 RepID=UPI0012FA73A3|nr:hypothetical protein [Microtetraspora fusca]
MVRTIAAGPSTGGGRRAGRHRRSRLARWAPGALALVFTAAVLRLNGVSSRDLVAFGLYLSLGLALPGVLLLRALLGAVPRAQQVAVGGDAGRRGGRALRRAGADRPGPDGSRLDAPVEGRGPDRLGSDGRAPDRLDADGSRAVRTPGEELALGVALGYAIEVPAYIAARAVGEPLLVLTWPAAVYLAFLAVPRLRRHWRRPPSGGAAAPRWWSCFLALLMAYLTVWSAVSFFAANGLTWPQAGTSLFDMPFHLALIGELRHHMPPQVPMVAGEPLLSHWFVYAHLASASWVTGVEPMVLLYRLAVLPMLAGFAVLTGTIGHRVTGSRVAAALAVAGTLLVSMPSLYGNTNGLLLWDGLQPSGWGSPSQMFGALLSAAVVLVLAELLEGRGGRGAWVLLAVLLAAVMGAKATPLPLLLGGLVVVAAVRAVRDRRPPWAALGALAMTAAFMAFAQFVLYGGTRQGMMVAPLSIARTTWVMVAGLGHAVEPGAASLAGMTAVYLLCWAVTWCGAAGLLGRPRLLARPSVALMAGMCAAGVGAVLLLGSSYLDEGYFLQSVYPYLAILSAYGFLTVMRRERPSRLAIAGAVAAGLLAAYLIRVLCGVTVPLGPGRPEAALYLPFAVALAVAALVAGAALVLRRRGVRAWSLALSVVAAMGMPGAWQARVLALGDAGGTDPAARRVVNPDREKVPRGALAAGRWLRAHSRPDDLVATNAHCVWGREDPCDSRHFWVTALSERRALVEGWAYTPTNMDLWGPGESVPRLPFWDAERLRLNDAAFRRPSPAAFQYLRDRFGVRWLVVEERRSPPIGDAANLRFRSGDYAVYRIPARLPG